METRIINTDKEYFVPIPDKILKKLNLKEGDIVFVEIIDNTIILKKCEDYL